MMDIDRIDCEILHELRNNARLSNKELADRIGLAASSTLVRVRSLQSAGLLLGYHADVEPKCLGVGLQAMISVRLRRHSEEDVVAFRSHALALPEVVRLYHVAGALDFLIHVWVRDPEHLRDLAMTSFTSRPEVGHIETGLIFEHAQSIDLPNYLTFDVGEE
jgi:DNA-binding Lrp family transcriptional regulator